MYKKDTRPTKRGLVDTDIGFVVSRLHNVYQVTKKDVSELSLDYFESSNHEPLGLLTLSTLEPTYNDTLRLFNITHNIIEASSRLILYSYGKYDSVSVEQIPLINQVY
jgi:hypothetical protein